MEGDGISATYMEDSDDEFEVEDQMIIAAACAACAAVLVYGTSLDQSDEDAVAVEESVKAIMQVCLPYQ